MRCTLKLNKAQADILPQIRMSLDLIKKIMLPTITNIFVIMCSDLKLMGDFTYTVILLSFQIHEIMSYVEHENMTEDYIQKVYCYMYTSAVTTGNIRF